MHVGRELVKDRILYIRIIYRQEFAQGCPVSPLRGVIDHDRGVHEAEKVAHISSCRSFHAEICASCHLKPYV